MTRFFYGEDTFTLAREIQKLKANFPGDAEELAVTKDLSDEALHRALADMLASQGLFASQKLILLKNFLDFAKDFPQTQEYLLQILKKPSADASLIFVQEECDKRLKFFKNLLQLADHREFRTPSGPDLEHWIMGFLQERNVQIEHDALAEFVSRLSAGDQDAPADLWRISAELEKLMLAGNGNTVTLAAVRELVQPNISYSVFALTNLFAEGKGAEATRLLEKMMEDGPAAELKIQTIQIIGGLASQIRSLLLVKDLETESSARIASQLGWKEGRVWINSRLAKKFAKEKLIKLLQDLRALDLRLKTSEEPPKLLLTLFLQKAKV